MEELQIIETTDGRQFKPWVTKDDLQDPASITALASEIASAKATIAEAINTKGGNSTSSESFNELAEDIKNLASSGVLSDGLTQSQPFRFLDYVCKMGAYPFTEINDNSVTTIDRPYAFYQQTALLNVTMPALTTISGRNVFRSCSALQSVTMSALTTISTGYVFEYCSALQSVTLPNLATISYEANFHQCVNLTEIILPNLTYVGGYGNFAGCDKLKNLVLGTLTLFGPSSQLNPGKPNLRNITIGQDTNINLDFHEWTATNVIAEGQSGIDELNANLQTNLIAKLYQGGNKVLRLGAALYDVTTQETRDMVTAKGWTLQRG